VCGDGDIENAEECDDGNTKSGDGCDSDCKIEAGCGDGVIDQNAGEQCDPPDPPDCSAECQLNYVDAKCGDGYKHEDEECDDGCMWGMAHVCEQGLDDDDGCSWECKIEGTCGNGELDDLEECDDGNNIPGDGCDPFCMGEDPPVGVCEPSPCCGDFQLNEGEGCDDGNLDFGDGCDDQCQIEEAPACEPSPCCGDGEIDDGEFCDDGNIDDGDGCSSQCASEAECGNGSPEGEEECDDGNFVNGDGCDANCEWESVCGDGKEEPPETCDDGNLVSGDGCDEACHTEGEGGSGTVTGTITYPGGSWGPTNNVYINFEIGTPPDVEPGWVWQKVVVTSFPYDFTLEEAPAGTFGMYVFADINGDGQEGENGVPGDPETGDADGIHIDFTNPQQFIVVEGETTAGINVKLEEIPPPPD
jgi:cysteine-rich repeat protein